MFRISLLTVLLVGLFAFNALAQVPQGISYQAVARTSEGDELVSESLFIRISVLENAVDGPISWQEEHSVTTNEFGLFQLIIGNGSPTGGGSSVNFSAMSWGESDHFLQVELDPGDGIYELMGITQLLSVPYALVAGRALNSDDADSDPQNELITGISIEEQELIIDQAGGSVSVDLSEALSDGDDNIGNESLTLLQLEGTVLNIVESGQALSVDLESLSSDEDWQIENSTVYNLSNRIGIGTDDPSSSIQISGSFASKIDLHNQDEPFFLEAIHHVLICDLSEGNREVVLPLAGQASGRMYIIKKISIDLASTEAIMNSLLISPQSGDFIDGENELLMDSFFREEITIMSDGNNWWIIARSTNE